MELLFSLAAGAVIGFSLGMLGGGGSILILPALTYGLGLPAGDAIVSTLAIVGATSLFAASLHWRRGHVRPRVALFFAAFGALGTHLGARLSEAVPEAAILVTLAIVMIAAAILMRKRRALSSASAREERLELIAVAALFTGFCTGFVGAGGGFLIVPALVLLAGFTMKDAVGTSLAVITLNCASGLWAHGADIEVGVVLPFLAASFTASAIGARLGHRAKSATLQRVFSYMLVVLACVILVDNLL